MKKANVPFLTIALLAPLFLSESATAEGKGGSGDRDEMVLYQVGRAGNYCVSITPDEKGCISGTTDEGDTINLMQLTKGKTVVFRNLSDAPHDMKFSGNNAEDLPAQQPRAADAQKRLNQEDPSKQKISCSFHGNQLAVGYRVPGKGEMAAAAGGGHDDPTGAPRQAEGGGAGNMAAGGGPGGIGRMTTTGLADVSREVLKKGRPEDVALLVANRPDLMQPLQEIRPLLAQEIATAKGASAMAISGKLPTTISAGTTGTGFGAMGGNTTTVAAGNGIPGSSPKFPGGSQGAASVTGGGGQGGNIAEKIDSLVEEDGGEETVVAENGEQEFQRAAAALGVGNLKRTRPGTDGKSVEGSRSLASLANEHLRGKVSTVRAAMDSASAGGKRGWLIALLLAAVAVGGRAVWSSTRKSARRL